MPLDTSTMKAAEAREHLARLNLSQQALARLIRVNPKTVRRWLAHDEPLDIPRAVQIMLRLISPAQVRRLIDAAEAEA